MASRDDSRQLAIECLGDDRAEFRAMAGEYRHVLVEALHALADRERQLRQRDRLIEHQRDELRKLRAAADAKIATAREAYRRLMAENRKLRGEALAADTKAAA